LRTSRDSPAVGATASAPYSARSAIMGSTCIARLAGT
jgi:hypothetical protein